MATKKSINNSTKDEVIICLGTKSKDVVFEYTDRYINDFFPKHCKDKLVIARDDKGLYLTGKSYIDANLLDSYRQYNRLVPIDNGDGTFTLPA